MAKMVERLRDRAEKMINFDYGSNYGYKQGTREIVLNPQG